MLSGTLQHRWKRKKNNVKSEANWSVFRRDFAPGFEDLFESGVNQGWYHVDKPLENLVFRWLAIPWIQSELDKWVLHRNRTCPRYDPKKVLPHGIPLVIRDKPEKFDAMDFKVIIPPELINRLEAEYAPPSHEVFQLVPPAFHEHATHFYEAIGRPLVTYQSFWGIYRQLHHAFEATIDLDPVISAIPDTVNRIDNEKLSLLPEMQELRGGDGVIGNSGKDDGHVYADFTDSD